MVGTQTKHGSDLDFPQVGCSDQCGMTVLQAGKTPARTDLSKVQNCGALLEVRQVPLSFPGQCIKLNGSVPPLGGDR